MSNSNVDQERLLSNDFLSTRYADILMKLLNDLKFESILKLKYENDYSGSVDIDVLLKDGRVFSYYYSYGSCYGCDDWEHRNLSDKIIKLEMLREATFFKDMQEYERFIKNKKGK